MELVADLIVLNRELFQFCERTLVILQTESNQKR